MEEWKEYKLGDLYDVHNGLSKGGKFFGSGYPFLSFKTVFNNYFLPPVLPDLVQSDEKEQGGYDIKRGDVFVTRTSETPEELGMSSVALKDYPFATYNGFTKRLRPKDTSIIYPEFIGYYLRSTKFRALFYGLASSMSTRASLANGDLLGMKVFLPTFSTQEKIASILKSLDDKIEVNRKINENLEQQAQALFKSWFVDFEPFKNGEFVESELGMIPKGWRVGTLGEVLNLRKDSYKKGSDLTLPYMPIDIIPMHSLGVNEFKDNKEAQSSLQTFEKNDIIIGAMRVYFHRVVIAPCKGITRNTCFVLKPKNNIMWAYCILECNQDEAINYANRTSKGSTMPYAVWENGFADYSIVIPLDSVLEMFNLLVSPILEKIRDSYKESRRLAELRDTLLPKLMSGELKVNEVEI